MYEKVYSAPKTPFLADSFWVKAQFLLFLKNNYRIFTFLVTFLQIYS